MGLSYDGGPFRGFAPNDGVRTVGGVLRAALEQVLQHEVPLTCAGRTDAGVHALAQVVSFDTTRPVDPEALRASLNGLCKPHIVVTDVAQVTSDFDARFSCIGRSYQYRILNRRLPDPFREAYTWRVSRPLDVDAMNAGTRHLIGTHDFSSFCRRQVVTIAGVEHEKTRIRNLRSVEWSPAADDEVHLAISASAFCQQMVRSITGLAVTIGLGELDPGDVPAVLAAHDRTRVARVAPPQGLYLVEATYPQQ